MELFSTTQYTRSVQQNTWSTLRKYQTRLNPVNRKAQKLRYGQRRTERPCRHAATRSSSQRQLLLRCCCCCCPLLHSLLSYASITLLCKLNTSPSIQVTPKIQTVIRYCQESTLQRLLLRCCCCCPLLLLLSAARYVSYYTVLI